MQKVSFRIFGGNIFEKSHVVIQLLRHQLRVNFVTEKKQSLVRLLKCFWYANAIISLPK